MIWPLPRWRAIGERVRSVSLKRVLRIAEIPCISTGRSMSGGESAWERRRTFFAQGAFACAPAESLTNGIAHGFHEGLVDLRGERVILEDVWTHLVRPKGPDAARREEIPTVLLFEKFANLAYWIADGDTASLNIFGDA